MNSLTAFLWAIFCLKPGRERLKKVLVFLSFIIISPGLSYADITYDSTDESIDAETSISIVKESIKINEDEFNKIVEQIAKRYPNVDWTTFDSLDPYVRRGVLKNYLAGLAFEEVRKNYIKDIHARAKDGVAVEKADKFNQITYFNKSDAKYRTDYITDKMIKDKAKKHHILHSYSMGNDWTLKYVKQQDVKILDEILAQEVAKAPVDMHCEKYCYGFDAHRQGVDQQILADIKSRIQEYQNVQRQYLSEMRKNGLARKEIKKERKKIADEIHTLEQRYANLEKIMQEGMKISGVSIDPYTETCEMVTATCWNVEKIPSNYERFSLLIDGDNDNGNNDIESIQYRHDNIANKTHIETSAWRNSTCELDTNDVHKYINCNIDISFFDEIQDFVAVRNWENQDRIDIKNGKMQDRDEKGLFKHKWAGDRIPGGEVVGHTLELSEMLEESITK